MPLYIYFIHDIFLVFLTGPTKSEEKRKFKNNINIYIYVHICYRNDPCSKLLGRNIFNISSYDPFYDSKFKK